MRLVLGFAIIVCLMNLLMYFFSGEVAGWLAFIVIVGGACIWCMWGGGGAVASHASFYEFNYSHGVFLLFGVAVLVWRLFGSFSLGYLAPLEGTGNHDELWYVFVADWLLNFGLNGEFVDSPDFPYFSAVGVNIGTLPRVGAESLVVFFSAISGAKIYQVYPVLFAVGSLLFIYSCALGAQVLGRRDPAFYYILVLVVAISPVSLFIYGNGNFSTIFGLVFLGAYYWFLNFALGEKEDIFCAIPCGVFMGAIISTYPELLSVAAPATLVISVQAVLLRKGGWGKVFVKVTLCGVVALLSAPAASYKMLVVLSTTGAAMLGDNVIYPELFSSISVFNFGLLFFAFDDRIFLEYFGVGGVFLVGSILVVTAIMAPGKIISSSFGLLIGCICVFVMFWAKNYGYGGMKAIEFIALPLSLIIGASISSLLVDFFSKDNSGAAVVRRRGGD